MFSWVQKERFKGFQIDSRKVRPGDLFFALKGEKVDGHAFLKEVRERGGQGAVVSKAYTGERYGLHCCAVEDVLKALQRLAQEVHQRRTCRVVGITGSVGKTTTKEFLATLFEGKFRVAKTPGNANSQVSVPLSILNGNGDAEVWVMEMGMSQKGELAQLVQIAPPEIGVVTKIALAHAAFFPGGLEEIAEAKAEIFSHPHTRLKVLNAQAAGFEVLRGGKRVVTYGFEEAADVVLHREGEWFCVGEGVRFALPFQAFHLCEDFLGAAVVARELGMTWEEIVGRVELLKPYEKRFEVVEWEGMTVVNDCYNANPTSMRAALLNLPVPKGGGRRIAVLGEMTPLGSFSEESHREIGRLALTVVDRLLCVGQECAPMVEVFEREGKEVELYVSVEAVRERLREVAEVGDVVLIKGSHSNQLWKVLEG